jgi:hypothetical protein
MNTNATIEELLDASFSMRSVPYAVKVGDWFSPELFVVKKKTLWCYNPRPPTPEMIYVLYMFVCVNIRFDLGLYSASLHPEVFGKHCCMPRIVPEASHEL